MFKRGLKLTFHSALVLLITFFIAGQANAATNVFEYSVTFSGDMPTGPAPYLTSTFDDTIAGGGYDVRLTVFAGNLSPDNEFVSKLYFNLDTSLDATLLTFSHVDISAIPKWNKKGDEILHGNNNQKADGDGFYDIFFDLPPPPGNFTDKLTDDESFVIDIGYTGAGTLDALSFNYFSVPGGGAGTYMSAAHIQGIPGGGSAWVATPEPVSSTLFIVGAATLGFRRFRKNKK